MQIQIKNIWKIENAIVNLDWLSVIAWNNDTWKTTVSKIVFSVIKAFQRYKNDFNISKEEILEEKIWDLYRVLRYFIRNIERSENKLNNLNDLLKKDFYPPIFLNELSIFWNEDIFEMKKNKILELWFKKWEKERILKELDNIKVEFLKEEKREDLIKKALKNILKSEFENQFNNNLWKRWIIELKEWKILLFKIILENNNILEVKINDDVLKIKDTTFIDSPIHLNLFNYLNIRTNIPWRRNRELPFHISDLFTKIRDSRFDEEKKNIFVKIIKEIVWWTFKVIRENFQDKLIFEKEWEKINPLNTATWIKSFWLLDLLDKSNNLESENLLILDEPEVHLHPEWQVKYARLIIDLIEERKLSVLITSHSPYMIEALSKFSKEKDINASFYLAEENGKWKCVIEDKTEKKYEIFEKLSKPFRNLMLK